MNPALYEHKIANSAVAVYPCIAIALKLRTFCFQLDRIFRGSETV